MESKFRFIVRMPEDSLREWLSNTELPDFSRLINKVPEEQFTLRRRGYFVEDEASGEDFFAIDAEMKIYEEIDGQWEPQFNTIRQCVQLRLRPGANDRVEVEGEIKAPKVVRDSIKHHLEEITRSFETSEGEAG